MSTRKLRSSFDRRKLNSNGAVEGLNLRGRASRKNIQTYRAAIWLASLACGSRMVVAQTNQPPATNAPPSTPSGTNVTHLQETTVIGKLDQSRNLIRCSRPKVKHGGQTS